VFDLVFIDGAHTWEPDSLAFLLSERLLRPGGWWIFDDLNWSIGSSPTARRPGPGQLTMREDELDACQIRDVIDLVVRPPPARRLLARERQVGLRPQESERGVCGRLAPRRRPAREGRSHAGACAGELP
jgi:Methyltransferase domain